MDTFAHDDKTKKVTYKIRLRAEKYGNFEKSFIERFSDNSWLTDLLMPLTAMNGPRQKDETQGGDTPGDKLI